MTTKVGLMGFGRIGRNLSCILYKRTTSSKWGYSNGYRAPRTVRLKQAIVHQGRGMIGLPNIAYLSESRAYVLVAGFRCSRFDWSAHNFGIRSVLLIMAEPLTR